MTTSIKANNLCIETLEALRNAQVDVSGAVLIEVQNDVFAGKHRLWVNVNGICVLRICQGDQIDFKTLPQSFPRSQL